MAQLWDTTTSGRVQLQPVESASRTVGAYPVVTAAGRRLVVAWTSPEESPSVIRVARWR